jgi:putative RecB family exonuclease
MMSLGEVKVRSEPCEPPGHLSPSSISTWLQCPLRFKLGRIDRIPEASTEAQILGSYTHEILEHLYLMEPQDRSIEASRFLAKKLWDEKWSDEVASLHLSLEQERLFRWNVWWCVEALFRMEDPTTTQLGGTEQRLEVQLDRFKLIGILDRWSPEGDGTVLISDYKTGKKPRPKYEAEKKFQLAIYTHLVQTSLDLEVSCTELLYLKEGIRWKFAPTAQYVESVLETVSSVSEELVQSCASGAFTAKPAKLCDWCSFKGICPAWNPSSQGTL